MEEQKNKAHKGKTTGNKAAKKDENRKRKAGIDLQPNRGTNLKAFQGPSAGSHKALKFFRSIEKRETALHVPHMDKTFKHIIEEPPLLVIVVGPPGVGKTTLIKSMVKFYSGRNLQTVRGAITIVAGRSRRITFLEVPNNLAAMCDAAKVADLVLLMVDGSYGFEMETFEFLNIAQVHGFPKIFGIVSHLDQLRTGKALKKRKKFLRHRFWHEVAAGAKLMCLSPMIRGVYRPTDVLNLHRLLICVEPKVQAWRNTHSCVLIDRQEDITDPDAVAADPNCNRAIAFYGYTRGKPMKPKQLVHIPGLGDFPVQHLSHQPDPCLSDQPPSGEGKSQGHRMRHLTAKQKKLYAPYCDVGGVTYDDDAIYVTDDAEKGTIERSGEGLQLLRELQRATPMDAGRTRLDMIGGGGGGSNGNATTNAHVRRPVVFRDEDKMELDMAAVRVPSDFDDSDNDSDYEDIVHGDDEVDPTAAAAAPRRMPKLSDFGLPNGGGEEDGGDGAKNNVDDANGDGNDDDAAAADGGGGGGFAPRMRNDHDSIRVNTLQHDWSDARLLRLLKDLCVTGNWEAGQGGEDGEDEEGGGEDSRGYDSDDADFDAEARGEKPMTHDKINRKGSDDDDEGNDDSDDDDERMSDAKVKVVMKDLSSSKGGPRRANALASVGYGDSRMNAISSSTAAEAAATASGSGFFDGDDEDDWRAFGPRGGNKHEDSDDDDYDILADGNDDGGEDADKAGGGGFSDDDDLNNLVASFLNAEDPRGGGGGGGGGARKAGGGGKAPASEDGIEYYSEQLARPRGGASSSGNGRGGDKHGKGRRTTEEADDAAEEAADAAVLRGGALTEDQERIMQKKMDKKKAFDEDYDVGGTVKSNTYAHYHHMTRKVEEKKEKLDEALDDVGEDIERKIQLVGYFSGLYVRFVIENVPVEYLRNFDPSLPLIAGGVNAGEDEYRIVQARIKRHRWYPKILKAQDPILLSIGWRRIQTQPIFATEDPNGRNRYLKYTPMHMHCLAAFYAPVTPPNTGFLAIPVRNQRTSNFRITCTGYTIGNDVTASVVKKLKLTGVPGRVEKTNAFIKGMFSSDIEAAKFVGAKLKSVSGVRGIIKSVMKGKQGLIRATFEDKIFLSDIVFIRAWKSVDPPRYCSIQRNLLDPNWVGMRTMRELRWDYGVPIPQNKDSEYSEIKRRHRSADEDEGGGSGGVAPGAAAGDAKGSGVLVSRSTKMQLPFDMKEEFIPLKRTSELEQRLKGATTVAPEAREQRRQALLDTFEDRADAMTQKKDEAKKRARDRAAKDSEKESEMYLKGLKKAKKETARTSEFRSQHKTRRNKE